MKPKTIFGYDPETLTYRNGIFYHGEETVMVLVAVTPQGITVRPLRHPLRHRQELDLFKEQTK